MKKKTNNIEQDIDNINPYETDKLSKIPSWLVIIILKYWAAAAAVFFMTIGGLDVGLDWSMTYENPTANLAVTVKLVMFIAVALALLGNYVVKQGVLMMNNRRNNTFRYNLINQTGFLAFIYYIIYSFIISFILAFLNIALSYNNLIINPFGTTDFGIEPFTYGFTFIVIDGIFVIIKNLFINIWDRIKFNSQINKKKYVVVNSDGSLSIKTGEKPESNSVEVTEEVNDNSQEGD